VGRWAMGDGGLPVDAGTDAGMGSDAGSDAGTDGGQTIGGSSPWLVVTGIATTTSQTVEGIDGFGNGGAAVMGSWSGGDDFGPGVPGYHAPPAGNGIDVFIAAYDGQGALSQFATFGGSGDDEGVGITVDSAGDILAAITTNGAITFGPAGANVLAPGACSSASSAVVKLDPDGGVAWAQLLTNTPNCPNAQFFRATAAGANPAGVSAIGGTELGAVNVNGAMAPPYGCRVFYGGFSTLAPYTSWAFGFDPDGGCLFGLAFNCNSSASVASIAVDDVTGDFYLLDSLGASPCVSASHVVSGAVATSLGITHLSADGGYVATGVFPSAASNAYPTGIVAHDGGIWAAWGTPNGPNGMLDVTVAGIDPGALTPYPAGLGQQTYGGSGNDYVRGLRWNGTLWIAGDFTGSPTFGPVDAGPADGGAYLASLDPNTLAVVSYRILKTSGPAGLGGLGISAGSVVLGGYFSGTLDLGTDAGRVNAPAADAGIPSLFFGQPGP
jgi:hypothetical protein